MTRPPPTATHRGSSPASHVYQRQASRKLVEESTKIVPRQDNSRGAPEAAAHDGVDLVDRPVLSRAHTEGWVIALRKVGSDVGDRREPAPRNIRGETAFGNVAPLPVATKSNMLDGIQGCPDIP